MNQQWSTHWGKPILMEMQILILREDNKHVEMKCFENTGRTLTVSATFLQGFLESFLTNHCSIILSQDLLLEDLIPR